MTRYLIAATGADALDGWSGAKVCDGPAAAAAEWTRVGAHMPLRVIRDGAVAHPTVDEAQAVYDVLAQEDS